MFPSYLQTKVIDVSDWKLDDQFGLYPEGARSKDAYFPPTQTEFGFIDYEKRYLFKRSRRAYPDQFWAEIVAYHIGSILEVKVPPAFAAFNPTDNTCGALIEWFYVDKKATYEKGGSYMQKAISNFDSKTGAQHNFHTVSVVCRDFNKDGLLKNWLTYWGEAFLFDALIGNTDRHQDNWGVIFYCNEGQERQARFSPLFDNGTSLGSERFPEHIIKWTEQRYLKYIEDGKLHMKWDLGSPSRDSHFSMVEKIINGNDELKNHLSRLINNFSLDEFRNKLTHLEKIEVPVMLTEARSNLFFKLVSMRHEKLISILK